MHSSPGAHGPSPTRPAWAWLVAPSQPSRPTAPPSPPPALLAQAPGPSGVEMLLGTVGLGSAAAILGASAGIRHPGAIDRSLAPAPAPPEGFPPTPPVGLLEARADAESSEPARLARELRATIEELITTRRTVGLQRAEIERASAVDQLTGVASRGAGLERLRLEA